MNKKMAQASKPAPDLSSDVISIFLLEKKGMECGFTEYLIPKDRLSGLTEVSRSLPDLFQVFLRRLEKRARELFQV